MQIGILALICHNEIFVIDRRTMAVGLTEVLSKTEPVVKVRRSLQVPRSLALVTDPLTMGITQGCRNGFRFFYKKSFKTS